MAGLTEHDRVMLALGSLQRDVSDVKSITVNQELRLGAIGVQMDTHNGETALISRQVVELMRKETEGKTYYLAYAGFILALILGFAGLIFAA